MKREMMLEGSKSLSGWSLLRNRLNPISANKPTANILQVLLWSTTLSSDRYLQQLLLTDHVDLFLTPPVQEFQLLNFGAYQELYNIGYEYTKKRLEEWSPQ